jgi:hypothetical protein
VEKKEYIGSHRYELERRKKKVLLEKSVIVIVTTKVVVEIIMIKIIITVDLRFVSPCIIVQF